MVLKLAQGWCAAWLVFQFLLPLIPTWGAFVPHDHWARQKITAAAMNAHGAEHRAGKPNPARQSAATSETKIISTYEQNGLSSFTAPLALGAQNAIRVVPAFSTCGVFYADIFFARALGDPPPVPPPERA